MRRSALVWLVGALAVLATPGGTIQAQTVWTYSLAWEHDGARLGFFRLCVDGRGCETLAAQRISGNTWGAPLPLLAAGDHRLVVEACNDGGCVAGRPDLVIRVQPVAVGPGVSPVPAPPSKTKDRPTNRGTFGDPP